MKINHLNFKGHEFITVANDLNLEITLSTFGASIFSIKYKNNYVTYHPESMEEFLISNKNYGKTLGRVCGRIRNGTFTLDDKIYYLEKNEKGNTLHSGANAISLKDFSYEIKESDNTLDVIFLYVSEDLEGGFPAEVKFIVTYSISKKEDKILINLEGYPNSKTPINMSNHTYWRLTGNDVLNHQLEINATQRTNVDLNNLLVLGQKRVDEIFDFRKPKLIGKDVYALANKEKVAKGYDHGFIFNNVNNYAILKNNHIILKIISDLDMMQVYTNNYPVGGPIKQYGKDIIYGGIAIEPQKYAKDILDLICDSKHPFRHQITFILGDY